MWKKIKSLTPFEWLFCLTVLTAVGLFVGGFFAPPMGEIDGSVVSAIGELIAIIALCEIPTIIRTAKKTTISAGNVRVDVEGQESEDNAEH